MEPLPPATSWTNHLREARLSGSTPGLHRTPSAPAAVVEADEYDPEAPDLEPEECKFTSISPGDCSFTEIV